MEGYFNEENLKPLKTAAKTVAEVGRRNLHHIARLLLLSSFMESGVRMVTIDWNDQCQFVEAVWSVNWYLAAALLVLFAAGQLVGAAMVVLQRETVFACGLLFATVVAQIASNSALWGVRDFLRCLSMIGCLILVLADSRRDGRKLFTGLPSAARPSHKQYLLLSGRVLLALMFLFVLRFDQLTPLVAVYDLFGVVLVCLIVVGYKTKLASFVLAVWLSIVNVYVNAWWTMPSGWPARGMRYYFFQTTSLCGGLLLVVALGPGGVSVDHLKQM